MLIKNQDLAKIISVWQKKMHRNYLVHNLSIFLGNRRISAYKDNLESLIKNFESMRVRMSIKLYFLRFYLEYFPDNCRK